MFYSTTCVRLRYGYDKNLFRGFSWELVYHRYPIVRGRSVLSSSTGRTDLPIRPLSTLFNLLFRQQADVSRLRLPITLYRSNGILTVSSIGFSFRMILRARLTLIRLALIRNPWSYGEGVSRPLYRYLYLHLLFHTLQNGSRHAFNAEWNAPLPIIADSIASADNLIPDYYPRPIPRLVSCYALFK